LGTRRWRAPRASGREPRTEHAGDVARRRVLLAQRLLDPLARADQRAPRVEGAGQRLGDLLRLRVALEELGERRLAEDDVGERDLRRAEQAARRELGELVD